VIAFLADEDLNGRIVRGLLRLEDEINVPRTVIALSPAHPTNFDIRSQIKVRGTFISLFISSWTVNSYPTLHVVDNAEPHQSHPTQLKQSK
jgi:hypothetical protein